MEPLHRQTHGVELPGEDLHHALGVAEDEPPVSPLLLEEQADALGLFGFGDLYIILLDQVEGGVPLVPLDHLRILEEPLGETEDGGGHGGGEEGRLPVLRGVVKDALDVIHKAHVQHLVGLVQDGETDGAELEGAAVEMVDDPAGGAYHDGGFFQGADLGVDVLSAIDGHHPESLLIFGEFPQLVADLHGQLPGGAQDQHLGVGGVVGILHQLDGGDAEGGGLARAGAGLADGVPAAHEHRDDLFLNRGKVFIARVLDGADHLRREVQGL